MFPPVFPRALPRALALAAGVCATSARAGTDDDAVARGAYLAQIMDCAGCHMPRDGDGAPMADAGLSGGTIGFELPGLGIFWPPNLTSGAAGLGAWSDEEIRTALQTGTRPDGRVLVPVMPWPAYAALSDEDAVALVAWLRTLPPAESAAPPPAASAETAAAPFYRVTFPRR